MNIQVGSTEGKWQCCVVSYKTQSAASRTDTGLSVFWFHQYLDDKSIDVKYNSCSESYTPTNALLHK